jgi:cell volume regulation protein A
MESSYARKAMEKVVDISLIIVFIGILIFLGHLFESLFDLIKVPDLLFLILIGLVAGPVLGLVSPDQFGLVGPIFAMITLIIILFEGGLNLRFEVIAGSLARASLLTVTNFIVSFLVSGALVMLLFDLPLLPSLLFGSIIGGITSAVVIPLIRYLHLKEESVALLSLESALSDVLCIVVFIALLEMYKFGGFDARAAIGKIVASILVAAIIGIAGGIGWAAIHKRIVIFQNIFSTPAFVFILFGVVEWLGFSGAIAALAFGMTLGNIRQFQGLSMLQRAGTLQEIEISRTERLFFTEMVFLFKTFFFIFIGLSIPIAQNSILLAGLGITGLLYLLRIPITRFAIPEATPLWDAIIIAIMVPKGLAAAVLASIPVQEGVEGGLLVQDLAYSVILFSIVLNALLIFFMERTSLPNLYRKMFRKLGGSYAS